MTERREWWIAADSLGEVNTHDTEVWALHSRGSGNDVHVREVLPGDNEGPEGWTVVSMDTHSVLLTNHYGKRKRYFLGSEIEQDEQ